MELHDYLIRMPRRETVSLIPIGDIHLGTRVADKRKLKLLVNWIARQRKVYVIGTGDYVEGINYSDPRFDPDMTPKELKEVLATIVPHQMREIAEIFSPIAHRIIGLSDGNHELAVKRHYHYDVTGELCRILNVKYLGWTSITRVRLLVHQHGKWLKNSQEYVVTILTEHSRVAGKKKGSKINSLEDRSNDFDCDIFIRAHSHDKVATTKTALYVPKIGPLRLLEKKRVYAINPSFFNTYGEGCASYGEIAGYPPTSTGAVRIDLIPKESGELDYHIYQ